MKFSAKSILTTSLFVSALLAAPLAYSEVQHSKGMAMDDQHNEQMMSKKDVKNEMHDMSNMVSEARTTTDMNKRHELMMEHMAKMQNMMGKMKGMMGDNMPGDMTMEQRQGMMGERMDMMQGMMEQMMSQQSMLMENKK